MRNAKREVECLKRLQQLSPVYEELVAFFVQEKLISAEELKVLKIAPEQARLLQVKLAALSTEQKIQLLEYEWTILPVERIKLNIVTDRGHREFIAEG
jgi:hypothetical protein